MAGGSVMERERKKSLLEMLRGRRTQAMEVNQSVGLSRVSPLCSEEGQAFNSLFSLHSPHAGLYFCVTTAVLTSPKTPTTCKD